MIEQWITPIQNIIVSIVTGILKALNNLFPSLYYELLLVLSIIIAYLLNRSRKFFDIIQAGGIPFYLSAVSLLFLIFIIISKLGGIILV